MRHNYKGRKLGTSPPHTKAMKRSLTAALLYNDRIKTIESRAKEIHGHLFRTLIQSLRYMTRLSIQSGIEMHVVV